jgi:hypothetical protein
MAGMIQQVRDCKYARPFIPFKIRTVEGMEFIISEFVHVGTWPGGTRVGVFNDEGVYFSLTESSIDSVEMMSAE